MKATVFSPGKTNPVGRHILVVEDEHYMANSIKFILSLENYRVATAGDGREAIRKIVAEMERCHPFDLIVADIWMPGLPGLEMFRELGKLKISTPVLVITAMDRSRVADITAGSPVEYMFKPFDDAALLERVNYILKKDQQ